ncbi:DsbC family protein [Pseudomonas putida]|nr:DsbC family protein [Pseudomonas putida]
MFNLSKFATVFMLSLGASQIVQAGDPVFPTSVTGKSQQAISDPVAQRVIDKTVTLPVTGILATEKSGKVVVLSTNGRYTIVGDVIDNWSKKKLSSLDEIRESSQIIPLKSMNLNLQELDPVTVGRGGKTVVIFSDPYCAYCKKVIDQVKDIDPNEFTVHIMPLGLLGKESEVRVADIYCAKNKRAANSLFLASDTTTPIERIKGTCDGEAFMKRSVAAQIFGVTAVPFVIRDDGHYVRGVPSTSLKEFLNN